MFSYRPSSDSGTPWTTLLRPQPRCGLVHRCISLERSSVLDWARSLTKHRMLVGPGNRYVRAGARKCAHRLASPVRVETDRGLGICVHDQGGRNERRQTTATSRAAGAPGERTAGLLEGDCRLPESRRKYRPAVGERKFTRP